MINERTNPMALVFSIFSLVGLFLTIGIFAFGIRGSMNATESTALVIGIGWAAILILSVPLKSSFFHPRMSFFWF